MQGADVLATVQPLVVVLPLLDPEGLAETLGEAVPLKGDGAPLIVSDEGAPAEGAIFGTGVPGVELV
jgi:hypothetical protein